MLDCVDKIKKCIVGGDESKKMEWKEEEIKIRKKKGKRGHQMKYVRDEEQEKIKDYVREKKRN